MMKLNRIIGLMLMVVLVCGGVADGQQILDSIHTWHVDPSGDTGNPGHPQQYPIDLAADAKETIAQAITAAASGDTICIWPGTYVEQVDLPTAAKTLRLVGMGTRDQVKIAPADGDGVILDDYCEIHNLTAQGGSGNGDVGIYAQGVEHAIIDNCVGFALSMIGAVDGIQFNDSYDIKVSNSYFYATWDGAVATNAKGLVCDKCTFETLGTFVGLAHRGFLNATGMFRDCTFIFRNTDSTETTDKYGVIAKAGGNFINCQFIADGDKGSGDEIEADMIACSGAGNFLNCDFHADANAVSTETALAGNPAAFYWNCTNSNGVITGTISSGNETYYDAFNAMGFAIAISGVTLKANAVSSATLADSAATKIVDDWETQSQADPTGFHVNLLEILGGGQSATDLKDFADDGYDPSTDKVGGVVLVDTTTTNTDLVSAGDVVDEWESQSQADPTGFHVNLQEILGGGQSATDLKDFADDGYDPSTDKVQGVVLVDTTTTNTDLVTAGAVVNEWETQSQADPTGFHVNLLEILGESASSLLEMVTFNQNRTTSGKATGLITIYDTDNETPIGTKVRDNTNSHYIYSGFKDVVTLAETVTATTWNVAGTIMTNGSATWDTGGVTLVEVGDIVEVIFGTQAEAGEYVVESVDSDTQITLETGIEDGGQPSVVTYVIKQAI